MTELELIIQDLDGIGTELFNKYGMESYNMRRKLHDIKDQLKAINYSQCCKKLPSRDEAKIEMKEYASNYYEDSETKEVLEFAIGFMHCFNWIAEKKQN